MVCDYWFIRRRKLKIPDLYTADGIFWYNYGLNWKAFLVFFICIAPSFREFDPESHFCMLIDSVAGLINSVNHMKISDGLYHFFQCAYFFGYACSILLFGAICTILPPPGNRIMEEMDDDLINGYGPTDLGVASINQSQINVTDGGEKGNIIIDTSSPEGR